MTEVTSILYNTRKSLWEGGCTWWHMPTASAFKRLMEEDYCKFKANLG